MKYSNRNDHFGARATAPDPCTLHTTVNDRSTQSYGSEGARAPAVPDRPAIGGEPRWLTDRAHENGPRPSYLVGGRWGLNPR